MFERFAYEAGTTNVISVDVSSAPVINQKSGRTFSGTTIPNYRTLRSSNGFLPTTNCSDFIYNLRGNPVEYCEYEYGEWGKRVSLVVLNVRALDWYSIPGDGSELIDIVWSKLRRKVLDQDFNAPVFLAEAGKTVDMIVNTATRLTRAYSAFRKGRLKVMFDELGVTPRTSGNSWLEYKYGWMPLLMDIHGGAKFLAEREFKPKIQTLKATSKKTLDILTASQPSLVGKTDFVAKAWVTVRLNEPNVATVNRLGGLNPLLVAWELVPFSFVADWFVNIGDCLAEATAFAGVQVLTSGQSLSSTFNGKVVASDEFQKRGETQAYLRLYARSDSLQILPTLRVKSDPLDLSKIVTSAALLRQVTSRGRSSARL